MLSAGSDNVDFISGQVLDFLFKKSFFEFKAKQFFHIGVSNTVMTDSAKTVPESTGMECRNVSYCI